MEKEDYFESYEDYDCENDTDYIEKKSYKAQQLSEFAIEYGIWLGNRAGKDLTPHEELHRKVCENIIKMESEILDYKVEKYNSNPWNSEYNVHLDEHY